MRAHSPIGGLPNIHRGSLIHILAVIFSSLRSSLLLSVMHSMAMSVASVTLKLFTCLRIAINSQVPSLLLDL